MLKIRNLSISKNNFYSFNLKTFTVNQYNVTVTTENHKAIAKLSDTTIEVKRPLEMLLGVLGTCLMHTLKYNSEQDNILFQKSEAKIHAEYDNEILTGKKSGKNTYSFINVDIYVHTKESDKSKARETAKKTFNMCPVASTLRLAGIKINENKKFL